MKTGIKVFDSMTEQPIFLSPKDTIEFCAEEMEKHHVGTIIIKENHKIVGIISEQDIVRNIIAKKINPIGKSVKDYMEKKLLTITPDKDIFDALMIMRDSNIRHLPVIDGDKVLGLLTVKDILKIEPQLFELLADRIELREEEKKPISKPKPNEGVCELCGNYTETIIEKNGSRVCDECKDDV